MYKRPTTRPSQYVLPTPQTLSVFLDDISQVEIVSIELTLSTVSSLLGDHGIVLHSCHLPSPVDAKSSSGQVQVQVKLYLRTPIAAIDKP